MKFIKRLFILIVGLVVMTSTSGCLSPVENGGYNFVYPKSEVYIQISVSNGAQTKWLYDLIKEFEFENQDKHYHNDTMGVKFRVDEVDQIVTDMIGKSHINMFISDSGYSVNIKELADERKLVSIDDVAYAEQEIRGDENGKTPYSIDKKINPDYKPFLQGSDGKYYALPASGLRYGITYNANNFNEFGFYLADPETANEQNSVTFTCKYGTATFVRAKNGELVKDGKKACGNDGVFGTWDDGTPTSLVELFVLCEYMQYRGVEPITVDAQNPRAKEYVYKALWASLSSMQSFQTTFSFDGEVDVVTGVTDQNAFDGIDYVKLPTTKKTTITLDNGNLANSSLARYYAMAVMRIFEKEGWYSSVSLNANNRWNDTIKKFMLDGRQVDGESYPCQGMLIETDRWYNIAEENGIVKTVKKLSFGKELDFRWMSMPTMVFDSVSPNDDNLPNPYFENQDFANSVFIANSYMADQQTVNICKDFLAYMYKDANLSAYSGKSSSFKNGMTYPVRLKDYENQNEFEQSLIISHNAMQKTISPVLTKYYNTDVDYYFNFDLGIDMYLGELIKRVNYMSIYELFNWSCTDTDEWEILKNGGKFEYIETPPEYVDPENPTDDPTLFPPEEENPDLPPDEE